METTTAPTASSLCQAQPAEHTAIRCTRGIGHAADRHTYLSPTTGRATTWPVAR